MNKYNIQATDNIKFAYENADYVIIAVPTDYNSDAKQLDVNVLYGVLSDAVKYNNNATIIIKSTVPIGCCEKISRLYSLDRLLFVPEFIREENILYDTYNPSRVVVGYNVLCDVNHEYASKYASLIKPLITGTKNIMFMNYNEAEAVKLFSNSYLAMRVSFFNELDAFAEHEKSNADIPLKEGPFTNFLRTIAHIQAQFPDKETAPIRTALVTARNAPAHERAIKTLRNWDVRVDEAFFLGGVSKKDVLSAFGAHIFFDDQYAHARPASEVVPSAVVPYREGDDPRQ